MYCLVEATERFTKKNQILESGTRLLQVIGFDGASALLREADGREWRLVQPEPLCLGLLCSSPRSETMTQFCDWWRVQSGDDLSLCEISASDADELMRDVFRLWLNQRLLAIIDVVAANNRDLFKQNSRLRRAYSSLQSTFSRLENHINVNRLQTPILQFDTRQIASFWRPEAPGETLRQTLPVLASRLSYLELYFQPAVEASNGELRFTLRLEPSAAILTEWQVPYANLRAGWNGFPCPPIIDDPNEVILECLWSALEGAPAIGLSEPHWDFAYGACATNPGDQVQTLAMRLWSALPGVRPPSALPAINQGGASDGQLMALSPSELARATQYEYSATVKRDYASVVYMDDCARLRVHPHCGATTIAELPGALPEGTRYVSADACTIDAKAKDIEYALLVVPPKLAPELILASLDKPASGFSGWSRLRAMEVCRLVVVLDRPAGPGYRIYLATRLPAGELEEGFAWATWGGIEFGSQWVPRCPPVVRLERAVDKKQSSPLRVGVTSAELAKAEQISNHSDIGYASVRFLHDYDALLVHPHEGQTTVARLPLPEGAISIAASCKTVFAQANPVFYAMRVAPQDSSEMEILSKEPGSGFSGWQLIDPTIKYRLLLTLANPAVGTDCLYLLTRLPGDSTEAYAWATWSDINIDVQRSAETQCGSQSLTSVTPFGDINSPTDGADQEQIYTFPAAPVVARSRQKKRVRGVTTSG